jgi:hypothetical protein
MAALESVKQMAEQATGWTRPSKDDIARLVQLGEADTYRFADDGTIPNHPNWPLIVYRDAGSAAGRVRSRGYLRSAV